MRGKRRDWGRSYCGCNCDPLAACHAKGGEWASSAALQWFWRNQQPAHSHRFKRSSQRRPLPTRSLAGRAIVSWSRLTTGRVRDPLVGRDVLWGVVLGVVWTLVIGVGLLILNRLGEVPQLPSQAILTGGREMVGVWLLNVVQCIGGTIEFFFAMFLLRIVLRNKWLAAAAFVAIWTTMNTLQNTRPEILAPVWLVVFSIAAYAVTRFGLITLAVAIFTANVLLNVPFTFDLSNWYATSALAVVLSFVAIAAWGFYASLGGQKLFHEDLFQ